MASKRLVAQHEIQKADPRARRTAIVTLGLATLAGLVLMLVVESQLSAWLEWITEDPEQMDDRLVLCGWGLALGVIVPMLLLAAYLWRLGSRIVHSGVFPPPGMRVVRDTRVLFGRRAVRRGRLLKVLAWLAGAVAMGFVFVLWRVASLLTASLGR